MNEKDFEIEVSNYIKGAFLEFSEFKKYIFKFFSVFHQICMKHGIKYYYAYGSLLGAVRDGGMIPWDADIDVLVRVDDMKKLIGFLQKELPSEYYVVSNFIDKNYYLCETRICSTKYDSDIVHLDIFYLIGSPNNDLKRNHFSKRVRRFFYNRALRFQPIKKGSTSRDRLVYYTKKMLRVFLGLKPNWFFNKQCENLLFKYSINDSNNWIVWASKGFAFPNEIFEPAVLSNVCGMDCIFPHDSSTFLKLSYGNYSEYLPISDRFMEFYQGYISFHNSRVSSIET